MQKLKLKERTDDRKRPPCSTRGMPTFGRQLRHKKKQILLDIITDTPFGEILTHGQLCSALGLPHTRRNRVAMQSILCHIRKIAEEAGAFLETLNGEGYRVVQHTEAMDICEGRIIKGVDIVTTAAHSTQNVRVDMEENAKERDILIGRQLRASRIASALRSALPIEMQRLAR